MRVSLDQKQNAENQQEPTLPSRTGIQLGEPLDMSHRIAVNSRRSIEGSVVLPMLITGGSFVAQAASVAGFVGAAILMSTGSAPSGLGVLVGSWVLSSGIVPSAFNEAHKAAGGTSLLTRSTVSPTANWATKIASYVKNELVDMTNDIRLPARIVSYTSAAALLGTTVVSSLNKGFGELWGHSAGTFCMGLLAGAYVMFSQGKTIGNNIRKTP